MESPLIRELAFLRMVVGHLGEQADPPWWRSKFCGNNGKAFLSPVFPRTYFLAQYQGVVSSAAIIHDEHIGKGNVFHLFRLPEDLEQSIHTMMINEKTIASFRDVLEDANVAKQYLSHYIVELSKDSIGPVMVGQLSLLRNSSAWKEVASLYFKGFEEKKEVFPFFSNRT